jgi:predicted nucleotidyltransferase
MQTASIKKIRSLLLSHNAKKDFIKLAYLFGSRPSGKIGPLSDYDIALLYSKAPPAQATYRMAHKIAARLMTDRIDLVVLNRAPIELRYAVIATGSIIYEVNVAVRVEFEATTLSRYGDFLPVLRQQRKEILEEQYDETGIQRYRTALGETQRLLEEIRTV